MIPFKFFSMNEMEKVVDEITAANDRRHGVAHLIAFFSLRDLIEHVKKRCPPKTPRNTYINSAKMYKGGLH